MPKTPPAPRSCRRTSFMWVGDQTSRQGSVTCDSRVLKNVSSRGPMFLQSSYVIWQGSWDIIEFRDCHLRELLNSKIVNRQNHCAVSQMLKPTCSPAEMLGACRVLCSWVRTVRRMVWVSLGVLSRLARMTTASFPGTAGHWFFRLSASFPHTLIEADEFLPLRPGASVVWDSTVAAPIGGDSDEDLRFPSTFREGAGWGDVTL